MLLNIEMRVLDGLRLARVVQALTPAADLVMMSGHPYLCRAVSDLLGPGGAVLAKPFAFDGRLSRLGDRHLPAPG
ncbi:hypothetical protein [Zavarzinia compransoris]|uniref:Response regulatory domain-containing protein n=1 Tax=Zavarzinia compransoris TaxID=1264899 RepID=A0A317E1N8_9PROT|nr:hypothetical protein [Zavarzinia compransoris]PWR20869.1 hypothetical protein DKG75_12825 [Zavarzinia compransoris]TDP44295.1 hypothetical protein DES42_10760 [Zavarzinia compransoris]